MQEQDAKAQSTTKEEVIYLAIDHLKKGTYRLDVLLDNKVIKSVTIIK